LVHKPNIRVLPNFLHVTPDIRRVKSLRYCAPIDVQQSDDDNNTGINHKGKQQRTTIVGTNAATHMLHIVINKTNSKKQQEKKYYPALLGKLNLCLLIL
jgi:hypothetical protein